MAEHKRTVVVPETMREVVDKVTCDLCGAEIEDEYWGDKNETEVELVRRTKWRCCVKHESGTAWPEGGHTSGRRYDICPKCFEEKLEPWLQSQGAKPSTFEYEF